MVCTRTSKHTNYEDVKQEKIENQPHEKDTPSSGIQNLKIYFGKWIQVFIMKLCWNPVNNNHNSQRIISQRKNERQRVTENKTHAQNEKQTQKGKFHHLFGECWRRVLNTIFYIQKRICPQVGTLAVTHKPMMHTAEKRKEKKSIAANCQSQNKMQISKLSKQKKMYFSWVEANG